VDPPLHKTVRQVVAIHCESVQTFEFFAVEPGLPAQQFRGLVCAGYLYRPRVFLRMVKRSSVDKPGVTIPRAR
jgi:hypothetical protein